MAFKVICIDDRWRARDDVPPNPTTPIFGEPYTVLFDDLDFSGKLFYKLQEIEGLWFEAKAFAKPSDIDETTFERTSIQQLV